MTDNASIVPPEPRKVRILCRPKMRVCFWISLVSAGAVVADLLMRSWVEPLFGKSWIPLLALATVAAGAGALTLIFRLTERPREVTVREFWRDDPPVIHLDEPRRE